MRPLKNLSEICVVGGGMTGLSAARHATRLGRLVTLFEGSGLYGGQLATVGHVDGLTVPGAFSGQDLAIALLDEARKIGVRIVEQPIEQLDAGERLTLHDAEGGVHFPEAMIVASGATLRRLGVPGEADYHGRGVSRCASCDGGFFRGEHVVVAGGGDAAFHEALTLAPLCGRVTMVCRGPVRAKRDYVDRLAARENVSFVWDSEAIAVTGHDRGVTAVRVRDVRTGAESEIACAGLFPFVGVEPAGGWLPERLRDADGLVVTDARFASADPRILAGGAARAGYGGNVVEAMAEGIGAAEAAHGRLAATRERRNAA